MRKHFLLIVLLSFFSFLQTEASETAVKIEATSLSNSSGTSYAIRFDDVLLGDHTAGSVDNDNRTREFTMSAWVKTTNQKGHIMGLIQAEQWTPAPSFSVRFSGDKLELFSRTKHNDGFPDGDAIADVTTETLAVDEWAFVTIVVSNANNKIALYKNGTLVTEDEFKGNQGAGLLPDASVFFIGNYEFEGAVNEIQLWNKVLSAEEIQRSMEQKSASENLIYHYYFDGTETDGIFLNKGAGGECNAAYSKLTVQHQGWYTSVSAAATVPTFVEGRPIPILTHTITLPTEVTNGTLTVMNGETALVAGENEVEEGAVLTITATPALGYILDYLKINDAPITESTYTVTGDAVITVAFVEEAVEAASKAIHVPANDGDIKYQFRFDDIVLGEHVNGTNNKWDNGIINRGDHRARNFTMSVWIRPLNRNGELFGHAQAPFYGAQGTFGVGIDSNNKLVLKARAWLDEGSCNGISNITSDETLNINEWAFLTVAVDDDARTIKLYKNGVLSATGDLSVTSDGTEAHGIGLLQDECVFFAGNGSASCDVDEVQVWNKTLSAEEIATSMESFTEAPENLIAFYKFDENSIENIPNQGTGVECTAGLVSGTSKYQGAPYWAEVYTCTPTQATLVDGHILPKLTVNYVSETDHGSFVIKNGDNTIASGSKVAQGSTLTIDATPAEGYQVKSIKVNDVEIVGNTFVLEEESTITVEFAEAYIVKYTASENGTLEVKVNNVIIENSTAVVSGTVLTIIAKPADNAVLSAFTINGVDKLSEINETMEMSVTVSEALDIQAEFSPLWKVTCNITGEGSVKIEDEDGNVYESGVSSIPDGSMITLTFTPEAGYELTDFTLDGASYIQHVADGKFVFEMDADYTFNVAFSQITSLHNTSADAVTVRYAAGTLHITGMNAGDRLDIYDVAGNYVRTSEEADTNVSDLTNGCYLVKVTAGNKVKTVKFIKR